MLLNLFTIKPITNNRAELQAIISAVEIFSLSKMKKSKNNILIIHTDSNYCIKTMTSYLYAWKKRGWLKANGKEPLNLDLICKLDNLVFKNKSKFTVEYKHVRAHKKQPLDKTSIKYFNWYGNNKADELARLGGLKSKKNIYIIIIYILNMIDSNNILDEIYDDVVNNNISDIDKLENKYLYDNTIKTNNRIDNIITYNKDPKKSKSSKNKYINQLFRVRPKDEFTLEFIKLFIPNGFDEHYIFTKEKNC